MINQLIGSCISNWLIGILFGIWIGNWLIGGWKGYSITW